MRILVLARVAALAALLSCVCPGLLLAQDDANDATIDIGALLLTWLPIMVIIVLWVVFFRRSGSWRLGSHVERSFQHMDKLERLNEEMLQSLQRIEEELRKGR